MKSFIYLPVEVSRRELCSKTMLAYKLAGYGISTIIFEHTYFDRHGWKYPGIYIGKNFFRTEFPHDTKYYKVMKENNIIEVADALTDILYVTYGAGHAFGLDLDRCFDEVQKSNMSKLGKDGKPIYNEKGKVMKGPNYFKPDLSKFLK